MIDKKLLRLLGDNKKYIFIAVSLMVLGLFANVTITGSLCYAIYLTVGLSEKADFNTFLLPAIGSRKKVSVSSFLRLMPSAAILASCKLAHGRKMHRPGLPSR